MAQEDGLALVLHNHVAGFPEVFDGEEFSGAADALAKYAEFVRDVLVELCGFREFSHLEFLELSTPYKDGETSSPLALVIGTPLKDEEGQLIGVSEAKHVLDMLGVITANAVLPPVLASHVGLDEEGMLGFTDEPSLKLSERFGNRLKLDDRYPAALSEEEEGELAEGLGSLLPQGDAEVVPIAPEELVHALPLFLSEGAGQFQKRRGGGGGPNVFRASGRLLGALFKAPASLLGALRKRSTLVLTNVWRVEDLLVFTGKTALKVAKKVARPVLVGYVVHRALEAVEASRSLPVRMSRLPPHKAIDLYYRTLLGDDYEAQVEADLAQALQEVDEGLITEDYVEEKRLLTAAMLRRLEVEEWDKERMKHFYLGSYGLGPWYFDMEERLHNPYFVGARAWNSPPEGWIGKNKTYPNDLPAGANRQKAAIAAIETALGKTLTDSQKARVLAAERPRPSDLLTREGGVLHGTLNPSSLEAAH